MIGRKQKKYINPLPVINVIKNSYTAITEVSKNKIKPYKWTSIELLQPLRTVYRFDTKNCLWI